MNTIIHRAVGCAAGVTAMAMAIGCATTKQAPPVTVQKDVPAAAATTTTTRAAVVPAAQSSSLNVSGDLAKACNLHFDDTAEAPKFDFDTSDLRHDDDVVLGQIATCLTTGPLAGHSIRLVGRADARGEVEYNFALGGRRADSVQRYLRALGVDAGHMTVTSRGKLDATGTEESTWQRDRRVDVDLM